MGKLYLTAAFVLAGSSVVAASFISTYLPAFATTFLSLIFASVTALLISGRDMFRTARLLAKETWKTIILQAILGIFLFRVFLTTGLRYMDAAEAGIITGATPVITALCAWMVLRERLSPRIIAGVFITFVGIMLVQGVPYAAAGNFKAYGVLWILGAAVCESLFTTLSRKINMGSENKNILPPLIHAGFVSIAAAVLCLIPALIEGAWSSVVHLPLSAWLALMWYGSVVTVAAFAFMFAGAKRCSGYTIAAFAGIIPISSTLLSVIILKEPVDSYQVIGCILVVTATFVIRKE